MKVLGFVNRQSRGVIRVKDDLERNENGAQQYDFSYGTAVLVIEHKSAIPDRLIVSAIEQGLIESESDIKTDIEPSKTDIRRFPSLLVKNVYDLIRLNPKIKYSEMEDNLGVTERTIARAIDTLKELGYIPKEHSKVKGVWQII